MILKSFVLIEKENRYLLIREAAKKWDKKWFLPGGKAKQNELPEIAAHRETKEEAGCDINILGIFLIKHVRHFLEDELTLFYGAKIAGEEVLKQTADKHSLDVKWFTYTEIQTLATRQNLIEIIESYNEKNLLLPHHFKLALK
jgi:8-oxo-dGTP diphosphatase